ncbi:MAG: hypothetical protein RJB66_1053 [Pseudomonadota bacterium]|jgi:DNA-binding transcriptional LysR family regulator
MEISLDQVRAIIAVADMGSITAAARKLHKTHTAILYQIKQLESHLGFMVLEREGYRSRLTAKGEIFLVEARRFVEAEERLLQKSRQIKSGGLGRWNLVYDAFFPSNVLLEIASDLQKKTPLSIHFLSDSLRQVEKTFWREESDFMLSLALPESRDLVSQPLGSLRSYLVIKKKHPILRNKSLEADQVKQWLFDNLIVVRGIDAHWPLSSDVQLAGGNYVVNDFYSKKEAILKGLGLGWMPEHLVFEELKNKEMVFFREAGDHEKQFPVFYSARSSLANDPLFAITKSMIVDSMWLHQ